MCKGSSTHINCQGAKGSVLDNKETFVRFLGNDEHNNARDFIKSLHRNYNLKLANALDSSDRAEDSDVNKAVRRLRYCSSVCIVTENEKGEKKIASTSKRCRHPLCQSCQQVRANRMRNRFADVMQSDDMKDYLKGKKAYLLTLTLKHNTKNVRNSVYLDELKQYVRKLILSKVWKKYFKYSKSEGGAGWFVNYEMTLTKNGFHIHSHILVVTDSIKQKISTVQADLQEKWGKLTKDSKTGLRIDLAGKKRKNSTVQNAESKTMISEACEIFKYSVKGLNIATNDKEKTDKVIDWLKATKGKNMVTAGGSFRGLGITASKVKGESMTRTEVQAVQPVQDTIVKAEIGLTSKIIYNKSTRRYYDDKKLKKTVSDTLITAIPQSFVDVTDVFDDVKILLSLGFTDSEVNNGLARWVDDIRSKVIAFESSPSFGSDEEITEHQLKLFKRSESSKAPPDFVSRY